MQKLEDGESIELIGDYVIKINQVTDDDVKVIYYSTSTKNVGGGKIKGLIKEANGVVGYNLEELKEKLIELFFLEGF